MENKSISLDDVLTSGRKRAVEEINSASYSIDEKVRKSFGVTESDASVIMEPVYDCFALHYAFLDKVNGNLPSTHRNIFSVMYSFFIGASESLSKICAEDQSSLKVRESGESSSFRGVEINALAYPPSQRHEFLSSLAKVVSDPALKSKLSLKELAVDYLTFVRDVSSELIFDPKYRKSLEAANRIELKYDGRIIRGVESGLGFSRESPGRTWESIVGCAQAKDYFQRLEKRVKNLKQARKIIDDLYALLPNVMMYGEPGTGKTMISNVFLSRTGLPYGTIYLGDVGSTYKDGAAINVEREFKKAKDVIRKGASDVYVILIDEMTSVGKKRFTGNKSNEDDKVVDVLLNNLGREQQHQGVFVIATTNSVNELSDPLRSRFEVMPVPLPDLEVQAGAISYFMGIYNSDPAQPVFRNGLDTMKAAEYCVNNNGSRYSPRKIRNMMDFMARYVVDAAIGGKRVSIDESTFMDIAAIFRDNNSVEDKLSFG